jgi:hypothetical protein
MRLGRHRPGSEDLGLPGPADDLDQRAADLDLVALGERVAALDPFAVDERPIGRAHVLDHGARRRVVADARVVA